MAGFWQLGRAEEKQALFAAFERSAEGLTRYDPVTDNETEQYLYQRFKLTGRYEPERQILLDNMMYDGRPGYHVLTPLRIGATAVLVNRGWLRAESRLHTRTRSTATEYGLAEKIVIPDHRGDRWPDRIPGPRLPVIAGSCRS
jgi:cytochrome oxidase assembly protein ShyY1